MPVRFESSTLVKLYFFLKVFDFGWIVQIDCWIYGCFDEVFVVFSHRSCHSVGGGNLPLQGSESL